MREIKFRAWDTTQPISEMLGWEIVRSNFWWYIDDDGIIMMQYTWLKDRNGVEIYEGDIVIDKNKHWKVFTIEYRIDREYVGYLPVEKWVNTLSTFVSWYNIEVIGNMYQNPEITQLVNNTEDTI